MSGGSQISLTSLERYHGALIGLAVGDALGTALEFSTRDSRPPITDMIGGGPFGLRPGEWTDDTSMAMCLAESLIQCKGFNAVDQMRRYVRWWREGYWSSTGVCFDIGRTTATPLRYFEKTSDPFAGSTNAQSAGNGSLMRLAPIALRYAAAPVAALRFAVDSSRTTHGAVEAVDACRYMAGLLIGALNGQDKRDILSAFFAPVGVNWTAEPLPETVAAIAGGSFISKSRNEIRASGYVLHTLEAALWAFHHSDSFRDGALLAVNLGEDADTTGAVYGQLAGAYYGVNDIPLVWRETIVRANDILSLATTLFAQSRTLPIANSGT